MANKAEKVVFDYVAHMIDRDNLDILPVLDFIVSNEPNNIRKNFMRLYSTLCEEIIEKIDNEQRDYFLGLSSPLWLLRSFCDALDEMIDNEQTTTIKRL